MTLSRKLGWHVNVAAALLLPLLAHAQQGRISGMVRDPEGKPVGGAKVTLTSEVTPSRLRQTTTSEEGTYKFEDLDSGEYRVAAEVAGLASPTPLRARISTATSALAIDITLSKKVSAQPAPPAAPPKLQLQAAGVRGLIDPGGYSAASQAASASGLVKGMADLKRAGNQIGDPEAAQLPCDLEPKLRKAAEATPPNAAANRDLGRFYLGHGQAERAVPFFERARQLDPADYAGSRDLALAWLKTGQFDSARDLLSALAQRQNQPEVHRLLARALEALNQFEQASQQYQMAATQDASEENLFGVGYELILAGLAADAGRAFEVGLQQQPQSVLLLLGVGTAQFLQGHAPESVQSFLRATEMDAADPRPYAFLADATGINGEDKRRVRESFAHFHELAPRSALASYYYAFSLWPDRGQSPVDAGRIESLLKQSILLDPKLAKAHYQLAILYAERGDQNEAAREFETTLQLAPNLKEAHYRLAMAYRQLHQDELADGEMQLFQSQNSGTSQRGEGIDIAQFISVAEPAKGAAAVSVQCPAGSNP